MYLRLGLTYLILLTYAQNVAPVRNGRTLPRRNIRRAIPSEFLTPPAPPLPLNRQQNFRQGKILTPQPTKGTETSGYFSQLMGWLNPFRDQQPQRATQKNGNIHGGFLQPPPPPPPNYGPPTPTAPQPPPSYQPPQASPPTSQAYLPPLNTFNGRSCDPCNTVPWIPIHQNVDVPQVNSGYGVPQQNVPVQSGVNLDIKPPDFNYGIQNPHMYPGAVPPLFKATAFDTHSADSGVNTEVIPFLGTQDLNSGAASSSFGAQSPESQGNNQFQGHNLGFDGISQQNTQEHQGFDQISKQQVHNSQSFDQISNQQVHTQGFDQGTNQQQGHQSFDGISNQQVQTQGFDQGTNQQQEHQSFDQISNQQVHNSQSFDQISNQQVHTQGFDQGTNQQQGHQSFDPPSGPSANSYVDILPPGAEVTGSDSSAFDSHQISEVAAASAQIETSQPTPTKPHSFETSSGHIIHVEESPVIDLSQEDSSEAPVILQNADGTYGINATWPDSSRSWQETQVYQNVNLNRTDKVVSTTESLIKSIIKSYNFDNSLESGNKESDRQAGARKNKVQIIIPYTSDHMPTPFHTHRSSEEKTRPQERSVMPTNHNPVDQEFQGSKAEDVDEDEDDEDEEDEEDEEFEEVEDLKKLFNDSWTQKKEESTVKPTTAKANTSIDVLRLQKNIDNWTIQEYSRGTTLTTSTPIYSHQLMQSKKIPDEYLTTESQTQESDRNTLEGFNFNDLEHESSASSHIDFSDIQSDNSLEEISTIPSDVSYNSNEDVSWEQLPVSISPLSNERVYVVTPQTPLKPAAFNSSNDSNNNNNNSSSSEVDAKNTTKLNSIEKSYQVLPQAVNNLAVVSTGPATVPLWGIMEHEEYASFNKTSPKTLVLYSGHSKVSHARS